MRKPNLDLILKDIEGSAEYIDSVVTELVSRYCSPLDEYMGYIEEVLTRGNSVTDTELEQFVLDLPNLLYFTGEGVESLGIREDLAKGIKQELYNKVHMETSGTVADKNAAAEKGTQEQFIIHTAFQRAYKKIKLRMDAGYEMLNSVKKVISKRMLEQELSSTNQGFNNYIPRREDR